MTEAQAALVWCPFPNREAAKEVASRLLDQNLIACANLFGEMESVFSWQGQIQTERECGALFKTSADKMPAVIAAIGALHPYETPAILGWNCDSAFPATLQWLKQELHED
ncbi:MAG: divalent-cation tolerance protein CutA [Pseudomonadota bacterium]